MPDSNLGARSHESFQIQIRAIVFQEDELWVAQCIEHDIRAKANTLIDLSKQLEITLQLECEESLKRTGRPFAGIPRAPMTFEEMWDKQSGAFPPVRRGPTETIAEPDSIDLELALYA